MESPTRDPDEPRAGAPHGLLKPADLKRLMRDLHKDPAAPRWDAADSGVVLGGFARGVAGGLRREAEEHEARKARLGHGHGRDEDLQRSLLRREAEALRANLHDWSSADFEPLRKLGEGGFGIVHLVGLRGTKELYALKQMKKAHYEHKNRQRAMAERDVLARLRSLWVVELLATFQDSDHIYIAMEFAPGGDLYSLLCRRGHFSPRETAFYAAELLEAVDAVHRHGVVHRDVKPENAVISAAGHLKLLDFGLCGQREAADPGRSEIVGTPLYMPPEAFRAAAGAPGDLWALGAVVFECLAGEPLFCGDGKADEAFRAVRRQIRDHEAVLAERLEWARRRVRIPAEAEGLLASVLCDEGRRLTARELRQEPFFQGLDFEDLQNSKPPFVPEPFLLEEGKDRGYSPLPKPGRAVDRDRGLQWAGYECGRPVA